MLEAPENLTTAEMLALDGFFSEILGVFSQEVSLKRRGIFDEDERIIAAIVPVYFSNAYAQSWWSANRNRWPARVILLVDKAVEKLPIGGNLQNLTKIRSNLQVIPVPQRQQ
jgi:hypothetical protein